MSIAKRKPTYTLCVKDSPDARWRNIGAAWETEKGNLFLKIDDGERLVGTAMLFPYRERPPGGSAFRHDAREYARPAAKVASAPPAEGDYMERKRAVRRNPPQPPAPQGDTVDLSVEPPDDLPWL